MDSPFRYPKVKHRRTQRPPVYTDYRRYKPHLRVEFSGQCVYCRGLDVNKHEAFGVDHYRPSSLFPHLATEYLNLFYACNRCNSLKRAYWPSSAEKKAGVFVPNPCEHVMWEHLRYSDGAVNGESPAGEYTVEHLLLNDEGVVTYRRSFSIALATLEAQIAAAHGTARAAKKIAAKEAAPERKRRAEQARAQAEVSARQLQDALTGLLGLAMPDTAARP